MAFDNKSLDDYVDVAQRIADFREQYPHGSLQPADPARPWEQAVVNGVSKDGKPYAMTMIVYVAAAYRTPDDPRPGIGVAWEAFPGRTPYTLGSELMNAETSAWGRAIIAVLASDSKRGVASRQEIRARLEENEDSQDGATGGRWMNRRPDLPPPHLVDKLVAGPRPGPELEQLRDGTVEATPADRPAKRVKAGQNGGGPWQDQPAGTFEETPPEERTGSIDGRQRSQIFAKLTILAITDATQQRTVLSDILRRKVTSRAELSWRDAEKVLEDLTARVEAKEAALASVQAAAEQDAAEVDAP
jgi:hypothetical protein